MTADVKGVVNQGVVPNVHISRFLTLTSTVNVKSISSLRYLLSLTYRRSGENKAASWNLFIQSWSEFISFVALGRSGADHTHEIER